MARFDKKIKLFGEVLSKGVWLYIADVKRYNERIFLYVGKTGYKYKLKETSPWGRLAAHLDGDTRSPNFLLHHLKNREISAEECVFELSCFGPNLVGDGASEAEEHEIIEEAEAQLAERLEAAGYPIVGQHAQRPKYQMRSKLITDKIVRSINKKYLTLLK